MTLPGIPPPLSEAPRARRRFLHPWRWLLVGLVAACAGCIERDVDAPPVSLLEAISATPLGGEPASAHFLVAVLHQTGSPTQAEHLRRALWARQFARLRGQSVALPPRTVGDAIAEGATRPPVEVQIAQQWQAAFRSSMRLAYASTDETQAPPWMTARAIGPGLWVEDDGHREGDALGDAGRQRHYALRASLLPIGDGGLPADGLRLQFGDGADALAMRCNTSPLRQLPGQPAGLLRSHAVSVRCEGDGAARWATLLPVLVGGGVQPRLTVSVPTAIEAQTEQGLWRDWSEALAVSGGWDQLVQSYREPGTAERSWSTSSRRLGPPTLRPIPPTRAERLRATLDAAWARVKPIVMVFCIALSVFGIGRLAMPHASTAARFWATLALCLVLGAPALMAVGNMGLQGDGWSNLGTIAAGASVFYAIVLGAMLATLLHVLHDLLDAEDLNWPQTIARGWRNALRVSGPASRGEFWGFVMFVLASLAVFVAIGPPWDNALTAIVALPLCTLIVRRLRSLTWHNIVEGLIVLLLLVLERMLRPD